MENIFNNFKYIIINNNNFNNNVRIKKMRTQNKEIESWYDINSNMIYVLKNHIWKKIKHQLLTLKIRNKWTISLYKIETKCIQYTYFLFCISFQKI